MLIQKPSEISSSEITPEHVYLSRNHFIKAAGGIGAALAVASCQRWMGATKIEENQQPPSSKALFDELGDPLTPYSSITTYNNYYEFGSDKQSPAERAKTFRTSPWEIVVDGLVRNPKTFGLEDLLRIFVQEERIYRLRCVEGWSMVIPWIGFSLAELLREVQPLSHADYVRFETVYAPGQMQMQNIKTYPWPYQEGLRIDEAMHELTILATGLYGKNMPPQNGAPIRLVVPWKFGFKSIKSIVRIELVQEKPLTFWRSIDPEEYGFFANVNPDISHSRWSQQSERRIGEISRRRTLLFNGYGEQVAHLYAGMDLRLDY
jgi:sulfoxide reductase catalytic subunit YedY